MLLAHAVRRTDPGIFMSRPHDIFKANPFFLSLLHSRAILVKSSSQGYRHADLGLMISIWYRYELAAVLTAVWVGSVSVTWGGRPVRLHQYATTQTWYSRCGIFIVSVFCLIRALNYTHVVLSLKAQEVWKDLGCGRRTWGLLNSTSEV